MTNSRNWANGVAPKGCQGERKWTSDARLDVFLPWALVGAMRSDRGIMAAMRVFAPQKARRGLAEEESRHLVMWLRVVESEGHCD
jgi:hypothetical protein